jgi:hypothetical protein
LRADHRAAIGVPEQIGICVESRRRISDMRAPVCFLRQPIRRLNIRNSRTSPLFDPF